MFLKIGPKLRQYALVITANLTSVCMGLSLVWAAPMLIKLRHATNPVLSRPVTEEEGSWIVSISQVSTCLTILLGASYLMDKIGRKYCMILAYVPKLMTCILYLSATEVWMLLLGRVLDGISDSFVVTAVPTYIAEIASKDIRGSLGSIFQISSSLGFVIMFSVGPVSSYTTVNVVYLCAAVISCIAVFFLPDSPYFLYTKGRKEEAMKVLILLRGSEAKATEELAEYLLTNSKKKINKRELLKNRTVVKTLVIVGFLGLGMQLMGYVPVTYYLQTVLESTQTNVRPEIASIVIGLIQLTAGFCTACVTDRVGRKPILISTVIGTSLGMIGLGTFFKLRDTGTPITGFLNYLPLLSIVFIVFFYSAGVGSIYFGLIPELFEGPARAMGVQCGVAIVTIVAFFVTKFFMFFTKLLGPDITYWIFAGNCIIFSLYIVYFIPETKRKTFSEIQKALGA